MNQHKTIAIPSTFVFFFAYANTVSSLQHLHPLQHFEANDGSPANKISHSNCGSSDTDLNSMEDDSNVLNLSRRRSSDTTNPTISTNNNNHNTSNNNHKSKNGRSTPPRSAFVSTK